MTLKLDKMSYYKIKKSKLLHRKSNYQIKSPSVPLCSKNFVFK